MKATVAALTLVVAAAQAPANRLVNGNAATESGWRRTGEAQIEECGGKRCFVVRNGGAFTQRVPLPPQAQKRFLLYIARISSERIDDEVTDRGYLYGMVFSADRRMLGFNQGRWLRHAPARANELAVVWGIYPVHDEASEVTFEMRQALRRGVPYTGSAARFTDAGLFIFDTEEAATAFAMRY